MCATEMGDVGEGKEGVGIPNFLFCIERNSCIEFTTNLGKQNLTCRSNISRHTLNSLLTYGTRYGKRYSNSALFWHPDSHLASFARHWSIWPHTFFTGPH